MHIAEVYVLCGIRPIVWVDEREAHIIHIVCNLVVRHMLSFYKRLLNHNLEVAFFGTSKAKHGQFCLREISIVKRYAVECKDWLDEIVEPYGFDECCAMVVNLGFASFGYLFTK